MFKCACQNNNNIGWYGTTFQSSYHGLKYSHFLLLKKELGSMYGEYGNPNLQVPLCPFRIQWFWHSWSSFRNTIWNNLDCKLSFGGINVLVILSNITRIKLLFHLLLFVNHFH